MFDLVWLGNYIVPRWEAFAVIGGSIVGICLLAFGVVVGGCWLAVYIGTRLSNLLPR